MINLINKLVLITLLYLVISIDLLANESYKILNSTYIGDQGTDDCDTVTVDPNGNTFLGCHSTSKYFSTQGAINFANQGGMDAFVIKINKHSNEIEFVTHLGGTKWEGVQGIVTDNLGNTYAVGTTYSHDFPISSEAQQKRFAGKSDAFIVKLDPHGHIIWSTFFGGAGDEDGRNLVLDEQGNVHIIGRTSSNNLEVTKGAIQPKLAGLTDAFLATFSPQGQLIFSSYLGGTGYDKGFDIKLLSSGKKVIVGSTYSEDFPVKNAPYNQYFGQEDMFVAILNDKNHRIEFATYIGGVGMDSGVAVAIDSKDNIFAVGQTHSPGMLTGLYFNDNDLRGKSDAFLVKINTQEHTLSHFSYLGGIGDDRPRNALVDSSDNIIVIGQTNSDKLGLNQPSTTTNGVSKWGSIVQFINSYLFDVHDNGFIIKLNNDGSNVLLSTTIGGDKEDVFEGAVIDKNNILTITGLSNSDNFHTINPLQSEFKGGRYDIVLMKILL